jgi:hypothetical protein
MQEMRITPELPIYGEVSQKIFLELIDGKLTTPEEMRAFLEPYSPPAPPPQVTIKRSRAKRAGARIKEAALEDEDSEDALPEEDLDSMGGDDEELDLGILPKGASADGIDDDLDADDEEDLDGDDAPPSSKKLAGKKGQKPAPVGKPAVAGKSVPIGKPGPAAKSAAAKPSAPPVPVKPAPVASSKKSAPAPAKAGKPTAKPAASAKAPAAKPASKAPAKKTAPAKTAAHKAKPKPPAKPAKKAPAKPAAKKPSSKKTKKR